MLLSLGYDYVDHRSDNYIEIIKGDTVNNVYLFGLKDATSAGHIQGLTLCSAFIDEAVIADRDGFNQLIGRCSIDGSKIFCSCNPESPYHWFYTDFIKQARKKNILYIHFTMDDNPSLSEEIKEEYRRMFSGVWADRFIAGKWEVANGLVYDMFNDDTHLIDFNDIPFEEAQKWCLGIDYGTANPTAALLCFKTYDGDIYVVDEYYHAGGQLKGMEDDDFDNITGYEEQKTDLEYTSDMRMFLTDHQGFTSLTWRQLDTVIDPAAASFCLQMRKMGMRVKHANNSVLDGIRTVATYLGNNRLFICGKCKNLIGELHDYSWDEKAQEKGDDRPKKEHDHACITGDTLIKTENGYVMIKDLVGTEGKVWTMNPETKEVFLSNYKNVMKTGVNRKLLRITFEDGNYIDVTSDHPILTEDGWKEAGNLTTEDNIVSALD